MRDSGSVFRRVMGISEGTLSRLRGMTWPGLIPTFPPFHDVYRCPGSTSATSNGSSTTVLGFAAFSLTGRTLTSGEFSAGALG